jgi:Na+-translocating ferredoxin:NAD+ oxidoreductase RnfE subunit
MSQGDDKRLLVGMYRPCVRGKSRIPISSCIIAASVTPVGMVVAGLSSNTPFNTGKPTI